MEKINSIFPFLWVTEGIEEKKIIQEIDAIYDCGLRAFCVESRIYNDFCGEKWWNLMNLILKIAEQKQMQVWLLDDKMYPTGYANGGVERNQDLRLRKIYIRRTDVLGEGKLEKFLIKDSSSDYNDRIIGAYLVKKKLNQFDFTNIIDVTNNIIGDYIFCVVEDGYYSLLVINESYGASEIPNHVDILNPKSVDLMISEVYQPHYQHFSKYFGKTFVGFFSDEPRIGNGVYDINLTKIDIYGCKLGLEGMSYPYNKEFGKVLSKRGIEGKKLLSLWFDIGESTPELRCRYMDELTKCYSVNFTGKLSEWAHKHNVLYAGHVIEDMDCHTKIGSGTGHFFRSMYGADFAACDIVLHQLKKGYEKMSFYSSLQTGKSDPKFFNHTLPKLVSSCAHIDKFKNGKALCEIFGAFGWGEKISEMLWMINTMIAGGINAFIPHAFSPVFPNPDCPPHFYANGNYPGYKGFSELMKYSEELCNTFSGGKPFINVAILYHAEAEWSGRPYSMIDDICTSFQCNQIDFDILPIEALEKGYVRDKKLFIEDNHYNILICPYAEFLPERSINILNKLNNLPKIIIKKDEKIDNKFIKKVREYIPESYVLREKDDCIRIYRYIKNGEEILFVFNTNRKYYNGFLLAKGVKKCLKTNLLNKEKENIDTKDKIEISLMPYEAALYQIGKSAYIEKNIIDHLNRIEIFDVSVKKYNKSEYIYYKTGKCTDINCENNMEDFSGKIKYECDTSGANEAEIYFEGEYLEAICGNQKVTSIFSPFKIKLNDKRLIMETANTLAFAMKDVDSKYSILGGAGVKFVNLIFWREK